MKINEVTNSKPIIEAPSVAGSTTSPGGIIIPASAKTAAPVAPAAKAAPAAAAPVPALATKAFTAADATKQDYTQDPGEKAMALVRPLIPKISASMREAWSQSVQDLMSRTINQSTGRPPVLSMGDIQKSQLEKAINNQLTYFMQKASGGQIYDFAHADLKIPNPEIQADIDKAKIEIEQDIGVIISKEINKQNQGLLNEKWNQVTKNLLLIANLVRFAPQTKLAAAQPRVQLDQKSKQWMIDGRVVFDPTNPQHLAIAKADERVR